MLRLNTSARSTAIALWLMLAASALTACKPSSTRPWTPPTPPPPPVVTCDHTPPPPQLPHVAPLQSAADLADADAWIRAAIGIYTTVVTVQQQEHACLDDLRKGRVIQ